MDKYSYSYLDDKGVYCYEGTDILVNKFDCRDDKMLATIERAYSSARQAQLNKTPIQGEFDFEHLKAIHFYLFQDVFYWAGKIRTVAIAKGNLFCLPQYIESYGNEIFSKLKRENYFKGYEKGHFIDSITELLGDINALHPFREGNGRTQREFIRCLGLANGYGFRWDTVDPKENIIASYESVNGDNTKLRSIIARIVFEL